ncbi:MAG: hypothetical protein ACHQ50_10160 [Fimbriimonadales bacterium]
MSAVPVHKPIIITRPKPQLRVEQGTRPSVASVVLARSAVFCMLSLCTFYGSSLAGQVMVEKARRDGISAVQRAKEAVKEDLLLRSQVQSLTRASAIDAWAEENGMVSPDLIVAQMTPTADTSTEKNAHAQAVH